jgi:flagellar basal body-associated protein FliL
VTMGRGATGPGKPGEAKEGKAQTEATFLFEGSNDESLLDQWEGRVQLDPEGESRPSATQTPEDAPRAAQPEATSPAPVAPSGKVTSPESVSSASPPVRARWRQIGKLRWLNAEGAMASWEEGTGSGKALFLAVVLVVGLGIVIVGALVAAMRAPQALQVQPMPREHSEMTMTGLFLPLKSPGRGILLSLTLVVSEETGRGEAPVHRQWVRECLYAVVQGKELAEVRGEIGMNQLKAALRNAMESGEPQVHVEAIHFTDYVVL